MVYEKKPAMPFDARMRQKCLCCLCLTILSACVLAVAGDALAQITFYEGGPSPTANLDVNGDGNIDAVDMVILMQLLETCTGDALYNLVADFDGDSCITGRDLSVITDLVPIPVDVDGDGDGDVIDIIAIDEQLEICAGDPDYNLAADLDGDGCVTNRDLTLIGTPVIHPIDTSTPLQLN